MAACAFDLTRKTTFATQSRLHGFQYKKCFKLTLSLSLTPLRARMVCYELKGDLNPVMLKEIFQDSFENFEIKSICIDQMLPTFGGRCNRYFWDIGLKILRLPNFNILFVLTKLNCFRVYRTLITWSSHAKSLFIQNNSKFLNKLKHAYPRRC